MSNKTDASGLRELAGMTPGLSDVQRAALERIASQLDSDVRQDEKYEALQAIGKSAYESIAGMVEALEVDYDRLSELREQRNAVSKAGTGDDLDLEEEEELKELEAAAGECEDREDAERYISEDPWSVQVRGGWHSIGDQENLNAPEEFEILLGTGGPATRIIGELDEHGQPTRARLQSQDWGTQWTDYRGTTSADGTQREHMPDDDTLLTYCRCFYFGEG